MLVCQFRNGQRFSQNCPDSGARIGGAIQGLFQTRNPTDWPFVPPARLGVLVSGTQLDRYPPDIGKVLFESRKNAENSSVFDQQKPCKQAIGFPTARGPQVRPNHPFLIGQKYTSAPRSGHRIESPKRADSGS